MGRTFAERQAAYEARKREPATGNGAASPRPVQRVANQPALSPAIGLKCRHIGDKLKESIEYACTTCGKLNPKVMQLAAYACDQFGQCTLGAKAPDVACCNNLGVLCSSFAAALIPPFTMPDKPTWSVAITTAPRKAMTLNRTVESIMQAGWVDNLRIFAEPTTQIPHLPSFVEVVHNREKLGGFGNWRAALRHSLQDGSDLVLMLQDDVIVRNDARAIVEAEWPAEAVLTSLYQSSLYDANTAVCGDWKTKGEFPYYGALAMAIPAATGEAILTDDELSAAHTQLNFDMSLGDWSDRVENPIYVRQLAQHIGDHSVMWPGALNDKKRTASIYIPERKTGGITAVLSAFKRTHLLEQQLDNLAAQTVPVEQVWVSMPAVGEEIPAENVELVNRLKREGRIDRVFTVSPDPGFQFRWLVALHAQTDFVYVVDDDTFAGERWLENCVETIGTHNGLIGSLGCTQLSVTNSEERILYGAYGPNETVAECDWIGWSYFMRPGMIASLFAEPWFRERNADDTMLCCRAKRLAGLRCYVPPHPVGDSSLWGSINPPKYGSGEEAASQHIPEFRADRTAVFIAEQQEGWEPLKGKL